MNFYNVETEKFSSPAIALGTSIQRESLNRRSLNM